MGVKVLSCSVNGHFGRIIEEDSGGTVGEQVAESILGGVVDPFFDVDGEAAVYLCSLMSFGTLGLSEIVIIDHLLAIFRVKYFFFLPVAE